MVQWVFEAALASSVGDSVMVATPDSEIIDAVHRFGGHAVLTSPEHPSGTDRLAEVARTVEADIYLNVQGDEPLIDPATIEACAGPLLSNTAVEMTSVYATCPEAEIDNPAVVKVVTSLEGDALYFSRYAIPYARVPRPDPVKKHIGIYGFRRDVLIRYAHWQQTPLEIAESLEQLRFLENGVRIRMVEGQASVLAVDTPEQAEEVRRHLERTAEARGI